MKATEQYFYYAVQGSSNFESVHKILKCDHSNERYWCNTFHLVVLFTMLCKVVLTFDSVYEILRCDHSMQMKITKQYFQ